MPRGDAGLQTRGKRPVCRPSGPAAGNCGSPPFRQPPAFQPPRRASSSPDPIGVCVALAAAAYGDVDPFQESRKLGSRRRKHPAYSVDGDANRSNTRHVDKESAMIETGYRNHIPHVNEHALATSCRIPPKWAEARAANRSSDANPETTSAISRPYWELRHASRSGARNRSSMHGFQPRRPPRERLQEQSSLPNQPTRTAYRNHA